MNTKKSSKKPAKPKRIYFMLSGGSITYDTAEEAAGAARNLLGDSSSTSVAVVMVIERQDGSKEVVTFIVIYADNKFEVRELEVMELLDVVEVAEDGDGNVVMTVKNRITGAVIIKSVVVENIDDFIEKLKKYLDDKRKEIEKSASTSISL